MSIEEAKEWLAGNRSTVNVVPQDPIETWEIRIAQADAAMMQQAYWCAIAEAALNAFKEVTK